MEKIQRRDDLGDAFAGDVEINGGGVDGSVPEELLDKIQIRPGFQQVSGKAVAEGMGSDVFLEACGLAGLGDDMLNGPGADGSVPDLSREEPIFRVIRLPVFPQ